MWQRKRNQAELESRLARAELSLKAIALLVSEEIARHDELDQRVDALHQ